MGAEVTYVGMQLSKASKNANESKDGKARKERMGEREARVGIVVATLGTRRFLVADRGVALHSIHSTASQSS